MKKILIKIQSDKSNRSMYLIFLLGGAIFFLLNSLTPYIADDYSMATAASFRDVLKLAYRHYFYINGRVVAHFFGYLFLWLPKWIFNIANTLVYLGFTILIYQHAALGKELKQSYRALLYVSIHLILFLYIANYGQTMLWLDGACNYLWTCTLILLFLLPYRKSIIDSQQANNISSASKAKVFCRALAMFGLGILAGWCNENTSGGAILLALLFAVMIFVRNRKLESWQWTGIAGAVIGFLFMISSPGNARRLEIVADSLQDHRSWYDQYSSRFLDLTNHYYENYKYLLFIIVILLITLISYKLYRQAILATIYLLTSVATTYALILAPFYEARSVFGSSVFLMIAVTSAGTDLFIYENRWYMAVKACVGMLAVAFAVNFVNAFIDISYFKVHSDRRDQYVIDRRDQGYRNIVVNEIDPRPKTPYNANYGLSELQNDPGGWPSTSYASYYGVDTVTAVKNGIFEKVFKDGDYRLINCRDIYEYLQLLNNPDYLVLMAVNDDSSGAMDDRLVELMHEFGLKTDLRENFRWSYIAVIDRGEVLYEDYANELLNYYEVLDGLPVEIQSSGKIYNKGNIASIKLDGYEYARNSGGLNIVVYDRTKGKVVDRVAFNTWDDLEASR